MTNESSSMTMKSDNESKLVNTSNNNNIVNNNNNIYYTCNISSSNKSAATTTASSPLSDLPSITLAPFAKIKREADCISSGSSVSDFNNTNRSSSSLVMKSVNSNNSNNHNSQVPTVSNSNNNNNNTVSAKMGSRRIFTPQFKLQVLESYRNDADCKGNQRATARKYNIHRRQIQKWLQCESNLRSSVANICANNVKHQFHNITHHQMPIVTNSTLPLPSSAAVASSSNNNQLQLQHHHQQQHHHHHHHHHQQHAHHNQQQYKAINNRLSLDTTRHSVALTSIQIPTSKGVLAATAAASSTSTSAAANNVGDVVGAVAPLSSSSSSSSPSSTAFMSTSTVKSLRAPTSPVHHSQQQILTKSSLGSVMAAAAAVSPSKGGQPLHAYHHHDGMSVHTPPASLSSVPVSVPIITPHPHTHLHVTNLKIHHYQHLHMEQHHHHHQQTHQHHNLHHPYNQVQLPPPPPQHQHQHQQSSERCSFVPSASLPVLPTSLSSSCSSSSASSSSYSTTTTSPSSPPTSKPLTAVALSCTDTLATNPAAVAVPLPMPLSLPLAAHVEENRIDELRDYRSTSTENRYMNENEYAAAVQSRTLMHRAYEGFHYLTLPMHMYPAAAASAMIAPIDLSLGPKRLAYSLASTLNENNNNGPEYTAIKYENQEQQPSSPKSEDQEEEDDESQLNVVDSDISESSSSVVDLTLRKRKVLMPTSADGDDVTAEKQTKTNEPSAEPPKTFKLFKPYLLDDDNNGNDDSNKSNDDSSSKISKQKDPIIWSHHTACLSPPISIDSLQSSSRGSNFQSPPADASYPFPAGSPTFQSTNAVTSSTAGFRCPKGSPVSGYESSSSIYSDSASSNGGDINASNTSPNPNSITISYHFDLKMQNINGDLAKNHVISPTPIKRPFIVEERDGERLPLLPSPSTHINHVQRWLDQESGIRQGIAVYV